MQRHLKLLMAIIVATTYALDAIAQTEIRGKVRDWKTGEPLAFANVYINQTTLGAAADEKGQFVIHNVPPGNFELKASFVGYETESRKIIAGESAVLEANFGLNPLSKELTELEVTGTHDRKWQRKFRQFKREFLGVSPNASQCEIVNPWVVEFDEDNPGVWILRATASEPIEIINKALGYRLFFHIRRFEIYKTKIASATPGSKNSRAMMKRRKNAGTGSAGKPGWEVRDTYSIACCTAALKKTVFRSMRKSARTMTWSGHPCSVLNSANVSYLTPSTLSPSEKRSNCTVFPLMVVWKFTTPAETTIHFIKT